MFRIRGNNIKVWRVVPLLTDVSRRTTSAEAPSNGQSKGKRMTLVATRDAEARFAGGCVEEVLKAAVPYLSCRVFPVIVFALLALFAPTLRDGCYHLYRLKIRRS
jgi:hypothetical protein